MKKLFAPALVTVIFLAGCNLEMEVPVEISKLGSGESFDITVALEIPSCSDFNDSRNPSDSLLKVQQKVSEELPNFKYKECYRKEMNSYAAFTAVAHYAELNLTDYSVQDADAENEILILDSRMEGGEDRTILSFSIPPSIKRSIVSIVKETYVPFTPVIKIGVKNDTGQAMTLNGVSSYVNGKATGMYWEGENQPGMSNTITFSNSMADRAMSQPSSFQPTEFLVISPKE